MTNMKRDKSMMEHSEPSFNNITMSSFDQVIMLKSVGWCFKVLNTMGRKT